MFLLVWFSKNLIHRTIIIIIWTTAEHLLCCYLVSSCLCKLKCMTHSINIWISIFWLMENQLEISSQMILFFIKRYYRPLRNIKSKLQHVIYHSKTKYFVIEIEKQIYHFSDIMLSFFNHVYTWLSYKAKKKNHQARPFIRNLHSIFVNHHIKNNLSDIADKNRKRNHKITVKTFIKKLWKSWLGK